MALTLLMAALLGVAVADSCFEYVCDSLGSTECAHKHDSTSIHITDDGCDCIVASLHLAYLEGEDIGTKIECSYDYSYSDSYSDSYSFYTNSWYDTYICGSRDSNVELDSGSYPKKCDDWTDCLLEDGDYNSCSCAYDGMSYCVPDISSSEYDDYWTGCDDNDGGEIFYGLHYYSIYPLQVNSPSCADNIVDELMALSDFDNDRSSAVALAFSVIGALAVLY
jgi:hypothetical protein